MENMNKSLLEIYNSMSDNKLNYEILNIILPKLKMIKQYDTLDDVELVCLIDALIDFHKKKQLDKINKETLELFKKMTKDELFDLERTLYFSINLRHLLIPYNINKCDSEIDVLMHISKFESLLDMIVISFDMNDYNMLSKYNYELSEIALLYKKVMDLYNEKIRKDKEEIVLYLNLSHMFAIFYFDQDEYNKDYAKFEEGMINTINNYQDFINYCYEEGICENFTKDILYIEEIEKEYASCKKMLDYIFKDKDKGKVKR